jgi:hypothetical protein
VEQNKSPVGEYRLTPGRGRGTFQAKHPYVRRPEKLPVCRSVGADTEEIGCEPLPSRPFER